MIAEYSDDLFYSGGVRPPLSRAHRAPLQRVIVTAFFISKGFLQREGQMPACAQRDRGFVRRLTPGSGYFHSHSLVWVFPFASTSYSNTAAIVLRRASLGDAVL